MNRLELFIPTEAYKEQILAYKEEFIRNGDSLDGTAGLHAAETFEEWYAALLDNSKEETKREGRVPATTYLVIRMEDSALVGMIDIRHRLNDYLFECGGHIGYSVRKSERRKGYATEMLKRSLMACRELGIAKVLVTCDKNNIASARTILSNGGILENEIIEDDGITQRYWITIQ